MTFRPALGMTIASAISLVILLSLGTWQLAKLPIKNQIISDFASRANGTPIQPPFEIAPEESQYRRLALNGIWLHHAEIQLTGQVFKGTAGYHVVTPMLLDDGRILIANRGWVPQRYRTPESRPSTLVSGRVMAEAILRLPKVKGGFVPENNIENNDWFTLNIGEIADNKNLGDRVIKAYSADVLRDGDGYELPIGIDATVDIPNNHWQYALTWYGIAFGLIGVYAVWHIQTGRLSRKGKA